MNNDLKQNKMATESVPKLVLTMAIPPIVSMFIQSMYNIVDSIFVSRISMDALTSVSLAYPMQMIMVALFVGTGAGISSLISRRLGEGNYEAAGKAANHGIAVNIIYSVIMAIIGIFFVQYYVNMITSDANLQKLTLQYLRIILVVSFGNFITQAGISILQSTGNTFTPMITQIVGAVINIILDPILIFGLFGMPALGVTGAALATVIGQLAAFVLTLKVLFKDENHLTLTLKKFKFNYKILKDIYIVGFPAIIMQSLASVMITGLNMILISFSSAAVAVLGIYFKLQSFIFMPIFGMCQGYRPILGYNFGAKNKHRVMEAFKTAIIVSVLIMIVGTVIFQVFAGPMLELFDSDAEMMRIGVKALRTISWTFIPAAVCITVSATFQALGKGIISLAVSFTRQIIVLLPCAFLLSRLGGVDYVWYSFMIGEVVAICICTPSLFFLFRRVFKTWENQ